jgi:hypothetical protein
LSTERLRAGSESALSAKVCRHLSRVCLLSALWSTNASDRWLDQHGWDKRDAVRESDART